MNAWLKENRCPHCKRHAQRACPYKVQPLQSGWRCYGYRSRYADMSPLERERERA